MKFIIIRNNNNTKHSSAFILDTIQTLMFMSSTSWTTTLKYQKSEFSVAHKTG